MPYGRYSGEASPRRALQLGNQRDGLSVERRVLGRPRRAEMRLQGDVAEVLQREHAQIVSVSEHVGDRYRHPLQQRGDVDERERANVERRRV